SKTSSASEPGHGVGGARAGHASGCWFSNPRWPRIRLETSPSWMNAITRMRPPQLAQRSTSSPNTLRSNAAQSRRRSRGNDWVGSWSLRWYRAFFASPQWTSGLENSVVIATMTVSFTLIAGTGVAVAVTRWRFAGARVLAGAVLLPLFVPAIV